MKKRYLLLLLITNIAIGQISPVDGIIKPQIAGINKTESVVAVVDNPILSPSFPYVLCGNTTLFLSIFPNNATYTLRVVFFEHWKWHLYKYLRSNCFQCQKN